MALKFINKINGKLKFLYTKNRFLSAELRRIVCDALIQPIDYTCPAWYPNLTEKTKNISYRNKGMRFWTKCITYLRRVLD